jgi:Cu/Ag efflux protein CusF
MRYRKFRILSVGLALIGGSIFPVYGATSTHTGKVVEAGAGKLTMTNPQGQNQHTHEIPAEATITCGDKKCRLEDLKAGTTVTIIMDKKGDQTVVTAVSTQ